MHLYMRNGGFKVGMRALVLIRENRQISYESYFSNLYKGKIWRNSDIDAAIQSANKVVARPREMKR